MTDEEDLRDAWDRGKPIEVDRTRREPTSVLSLRLPDSLMEELANRAREQGKAAGTLARETIEAALMEKMPVTPRTLASMFERWVSEALSPKPRSTFDLVFTSRTIADGFWVSQQKPFSLTNYELLEVATHSFTFKHPVVTSRKVEVETKSAGENAA